LNWRLFAGQSVLRIPCENLYNACAFMCYWSGIHPEGTQKVISDGVDLMLQTAIKLLEKQGDNNQAPALMDGADSSGDIDGEIRKDDIPDDQ
jgi:hypothetical protein